jgi:hypothetical protein
MPRLPLRLVLLASLLVVAVPGASAAGTVLPLPAIGQVKGDPAHDRFFVTGGKTGGSVVIVNAHGAIVRTIGGELGAAGLALAGTKMYVARCGQQAIDVFDTGTLAKVDSFAAPHLAGSCLIAYAGGRLWYGSDAQHGFLTSLRVTAPHTETITTEHLYGGGVFATAPSVPNRLVMAGAGVSPPDGTVYDVSGASPVLQVTRHILDSSDPDDMTLSPDGATLYVASGAPYEGRAYAVSDLMLRHAFPTGPYPRAIAVSPNGQSVGVGQAGVDTALHLFRADGSAETAKTAFIGSGNPTLLARSVAFTADGKRLIGVTEENYGAQRVLHVYNPFALTPPAMSVRVSKTKVTAGGRVTVTAKVGAWATGRVIALYGTPVGGAKALVRNVRVGATGTFALVVRPAGLTTYAVEFAGDDIYRAAASAGVAVKVRGTLKVRPSGSYRTRHGVRLFRYARATCWTLQRKCPAFTVTLAPALAGGRVKFTLQQKRGHAYRTLSTATFVVDAHGQVKVIWRYLGRGWINKPLRAHITAAGNAAFTTPAPKNVPFKITM